MSAIAIVDLDRSVELDSQALTAVIGGYSVTSTGPWNHYATTESKTNTVVKILGIKFRKWKRTKYAKRTQKGREHSYFLRLA